MYYEQLMQAAGIEKRAFTIPGAVIGAIHGSTKDGPGFGKGLVRGAGTGLGVDVGSTAGGLTGFGSGLLASGLLANRAEADAAGGLSRLLSRALKSKPKGRLAALSAGGLLTLPILGGAVGATSGGLLGGKLGYNLSRKLTS